MMDMVLIECLNMILKEFGLSKGERNNEKCINYNSSNISNNRCCIYDR